MLVHAHTSLPIVKVLKFWVFKFNGQVLKLHGQHFLSSSSAVYWCLPVCLWLVYCYISLIKDKVQRWKKCLLECLTLYRRMEPSNGVLHHSQNFINYIETVSSVMMEQMGMCKNTIDLQQENRRLSHTAKLD